MKQIRVVSVKRSKGRDPILSFARVINTLQLNSGKWRWSDGKLLLEYTSLVGRKLLTSFHKPKRTIPSKWNGLLSDTFTPVWQDDWNPAHLAKEAAFMWSIWHNAVAVNSWRAKIAASIDTQCPNCSMDHSETPFHRFFFCLRAQEAWNSGLFLGAFWWQIAPEKKSG